MNSPIYKLEVDYKDVNYYHYSDLCLNPSDATLGFILKKNILKNKGKLDWDSLCKNPNPQIIEFLELNIEEIIWSSFARNPNPKAAELFVKYKHLHPYNINQLSAIPDERIIKLLIDHPKKIVWSLFAMNTHDLAADYIINYIKTSNVPFLFLNILKNNPNDKIVDYFMEHKKEKLYHAYNNSNDRVVDLLIENNTDPNLLMYNKNPRIYHYMKERKVIQWTSPQIFKFDYDAMKRKIHSFKKELMSVALTTKRVEGLIKMEKDRLKTLGFTEDEADSMIDVESLT